MKKVVQTVIFPKEWGVKPARVWLKKHNYFSTGKVDRELFTLRFRQISPSKIRQSTYYSKVLPNGIILVNGALK